MNSWASSWCSDEARTTIVSVQTSLPVLLPAQADGVDGAADAAGAEGPEARPGAAEPVP